MTADPDAAAYGFRHVALLCHDDTDYRTTVRDLVQEAQARAEPVFIAMPGPQAEWLRRELGGHAADTRFADMAALGRNPARVASAQLAFTAERASTGAG